MPQLLKERYERWTKQSTKKRSNSRHRNSEYLLSGKIESKQDGEKRVGTKVGKKGYEQRRYRNKASRRKYLKGSVLNQKIDAEKVERAVLQQIVEARQDSDLVRETVKAVASQTQPDVDVEAECKKLAAEKDELVTKIKHAYPHLLAAALNAIQSDLDRMSERIETIERKLKRLEHARRTDPVDPDELAEAVLRRFAHLHEETQDAPIARLRQLIVAFVEKVVVDQETRVFEVNLRLPPRSRGVWWTRRSHQLAARHPHPRPRPRACLWPRKIRSDCWKWTAVI